MKCLFRYFALFLIKLFVFLLLSFNGSSYVLFDVLSDMYFVICFFFLQFVLFLFTVFIFCLRAEAFYFNEVQLVSYFF